MFFCTQNTGIFIYRKVFFAKKRLLLEYSEKKYIFSGTPTKESPFLQRELFLLHIFLYSFVLMPINRNTSILRKFSNATRISFMKNLNFISINSTTHFTIIYLYYIYVIICFLGFLLNLSDIRLRIKPLFCTKPLFFETFKKSSMPCRLSDEFLQAPSSSFLSFFR